MSCCSGPAGGRDQMGPAGNEAVGRREWGAGGKNGEQGSGACGDARRPGCALEETADGLAEADEQSVLYLLESLEEKIHNYNSSDTL